jgi:hypothetical protein
MASVREGGAAKVKWWFESALGTPLLSGAHLKDRSRGTKAERLFQVVFSE